MTGVIFSKEKSMPKEIDKFLTKFKKRACYF